MRNSVDEQSKTFSSSSNVNFATGKKATESPLNLSQISIADNVKILANFSLSTNENDNVGQYQDDNDNSTIRLYVDEPSQTFSASSNMNIDTEGNVTETPKNIPQTSFDNNVKILTNVYNSIYSDLKPKLNSTKTSENVLKITKKNKFVIIPRRQNISFSQKYDYRGHLRKKVAIKM